MEKEALIQWYKENNIEDIIEEKPCNHFDVSCETLPLQNQTTLRKLPSEEVNITIQNKVKMQVGTTEIKKEETIKYSSDGNKTSFNYIYQNLANKYRNDNMKMAQQNNSLDDVIKKSRELADSANTIDELKNIVENFDGYLEIKKLAKNTVFGEGNTKPDILILGEAPGNNEDIEGRPFCGQSGELLDNMFKAIGIPRKDLYITNTLFWRPPGNRTPTEQEVAICRPFVEKHIALINPKIIVFMGSTALTSLIETDLTITKARRQLFDYTNQYLQGKNIKSTPLFHPSYLLRQSGKKKDAWGDLLFVKNVIDNLS
ncbi:MAG: uracil-DNA glycosylase [Rickettsiales bacterium]|nr:uracil-DNA glycosylase [Rickettsiales bacterium]